MTPQLSLGAAPRDWVVSTCLFSDVRADFRFRINQGSTVVFTNFIQQNMPVGSRTGAGGADGQSEYSSPINPQKKIKY